MQGLTKSGSPLANVPVSPSEITITFQLPGSQPSPHKILQVRKAAQDGCQLPIELPCRQVSLSAVDEQM